MRNLTVILIAALVGSAVGAALAYVEVRSDHDAVAELAGENAVQPPAAQGETAARIEVVEPRFNFGKMERGRERSHEFVIRNVGTAPLKLRVGQTSCKCTLGEVTGDAIGPGESTHVRLEWSAQSDRGPFRQTAMLHTNDPRQPDVELTIEGEIVGATGVEPPDFMFDKLAVDESRSAEVYVMAMLQDELTVDSAELTDEHSRDKFDVRIEPVERDELPNKSARDGVRITLTAKPDLPVGRFNQFLTLNTNLKEGEKLHIPVIGSVVGDISVHGTGWLENEGVLVIGKVESSKGRKARVNLAVRGENAEDVTFEVGSVDPPELKVTIGEPMRLKATLVRVPVEIEVPPGTRSMARLATAQGEEAKIVLKTTHPKIKELSMGVRFAVER
ncbi:MAG: DUF1573 domain-containing protein [Planctomycetes bacterium]|nr:DUF1573 domain-containing protein [Planctomycetota bacterium]